jgi:hypothetical protein
MIAAISDSIRAEGVERARLMADWMCAVQRPWLDSDPGAGTLPFIIDRLGKEFAPNNWNLAFAAMGLLSAGKAFDEPRYETAALRIGRYLKTLQIFDPFRPELHGAIREMTPMTPWCYTRDALSAAWAFIELYRHTREEEYLERARLWGEWFVTHGCDEEGYPCWGHQFDPWMDKAPQMRNDVQGSFQGGSLNFLYHLGKETGDSSWTGEFFTNLADHFVKHVQQPSGFFCSIEKSTRKPPPTDPQGGLHRANDDLGTLGLLCAHKVSGKAEYLVAIEKFLEAVFSAQLEDGHFEESCACIPVVLNTVHEAGDLVAVRGARQLAAEDALRALYSRQNDGDCNPRQRGALDEVHVNQVCLRSTAYALIVLLKLFAGQRGLLSVETG